MLVLVPCSAVITADGDLENTVCYSFGRKWGPYARAVKDAEKAFKFTPATSESEAIPVYAHFSVTFSRLRGVETTYLKMNHGERSALHGDRYAEPQLYAGDFPDTPSRCLGGVQWVSMLVTAEGRAVSVRFGEQGAGASCQEELLAAIKEWRFIPAITEGQAVEMFFHHPLVGSRAMNSSAIVRIEQVVSR